MKALLIGGTGPTGPHIVRGLLARGVDVVLLNRGLHRRHAYEDLETLVADPHFEGSLAGALNGRVFDVVVAAYGRLRMMPPLLAPVTDRLITIGGTAYANTAGVPATEDAPRDVSNKLVARIVETEQVLERAHHDGLFVHTHLRYPLLWGPGQVAPKEWSIARRVRDCRPFIPIVDGGLTLESKSYVMNAAHAVLLAVDQPDVSSGRTYNVADEITVSDSRRTADLCAALGRGDMRQVSFPQVLTGPAAFWGVGRDLDAAGEGRQPSAHHRLVDATRIHDERGYRDVVSYDEAVRRTAEHYLSEPLPLGGEDEVKLGDPFAYGAEDAFEAALQEFIDRARAIPFHAGAFVHQYDHPKLPGETVV